MFYFGCESKIETGHFLFDNTFRRARKNSLFGLINDHLIRRLGIDGAFCPKEIRKEGVAKLTVSDEITILSFWDYSADSRPGSHSTFIEFGKLSFEQMLVIAQKTFPTVFERFDFEIVRYIPKEHRQK